MEELTILSFLIESTLCKILRGDQAERSLTADRDVVANPYEMENFRLDVNMVTFASLESLPFLI